MSPTWPDTAGLVLAGGEGSRLAAASVPKPLVEVGGTPLIVRQAETLGHLGCTSVTCMIRDEFPGAREALRRRTWLRPVAAHLCHTPSSLHTLAEGLAHVPEGPVFATMVDMVMRWEDWRACWSGSMEALAAGADVALAVTPFVDDERALWVTREADGLVRGLGEEPTDPPCVTGGVYAFAPGVRPLAALAVRSGMHRMRAFLADLVTRGLRITAVEVPRIIDLDRPSDLELANAWMAGGAL